MSKTNGVVGRARALCVPGTQFDTSARVTVFTATAEILRGRGPLTPEQDRVVGRLVGSDLRSSDRVALVELGDSLTGGDLRVFQHAVKLSHYGPDREEQVVAPELLKRIAGAAAVVEAQRLVGNSKFDGVVAAGGALRKARTPDEVERRRSELREAEEAWRLAREAHERAIVALNTLYLERDARHRAASLAALTK